MKKCQELLAFDKECRLLPDERKNQDADSCQNKRKRKNLSHIENHILLETDLRLLYEFNQEAHAETSDKEGTEEEAAAASGTAASET